MDLIAGITGKQEQTVTSEQTALTVGSGDLSVYATPMMAALMEKAAAQSVQPYLKEGESTVGTMIHINHNSATPVGCKITASSLLLEVSGKRLVFQVDAFDESGRIGTGTHERVIIDKERFLQKTKEKKGAV